MCYCALYVGKVQSDLVWAHWRRIVVKSEKGIQSFSKYDPDTKHVLMQCNLCRLSGMVSWTQIKLYPRLNMFFNDKSPLMLQFSPR